MPPTTIGSFAFDTPESTTSEMVAFITGDGFRLKVTMPFSAPEGAFRCKWAVERRSPTEWKHWANDVAFGASPEAAISGACDQALAFMALSQKRIAILQELVQEHGQGRLDRAKAMGWLSDAGPEMTHGVWDHFKGGVYRTTDVVLCVETEKLQVCYENTEGRKFARYIEVWNELVQWPDGEWRSRYVRRPNPATIPSFKVQKKE